MFSLEKSNRFFFIIAFLARIICQDLLELEFKTLTFFVGICLRDLVEINRKGKAKMHK